MTVKGGCPEISGIVVRDLGGGNQKDRTIIIHLFQGEKGVEAVVLVVENTTGLIQSHQSVVVRVHPIEPGNHPGHDQDHQGVTK